MEYTKREKIIIELFQHRIKELEERITLLEFAFSHNSRIIDKPIKGIGQTRDSFGNEIIEIDTD